MSDQTTTARIAAEDMRVLQWHAKTDVCAHGHPSGAIARVLLHLLEQAAPEQPAPDAVVDTMCYECGCMEGLHAGTCSKVQPAPDVVRTPQPADHAPAQDEPRYTQADLDASHEAGRLAGWNEAVEAAAVCERKARAHELLGDSTALAFAATTIRALKRPAGTT